MRHATPFARPLAWAAGAAALLAATPALAAWVTCESRYGSQEYCRADTRGGVDLERQLSSRPCVRGDTWGFNRNGIWVTAGCRAQFWTNDGSRRDRGGSSDAAAAAAVAAIVGTAIIAGAANDDASDARRGCITEAASHFGLRRSDVGASDAERIGRDEFRVRITTRRGDARCVADDDGNVLSFRER